jgi:putative heme iron utilization protein
MNEDHAQNLRDYAHAFAQLNWVTECRMTALDRFGFVLSCTGGDRTERVRIGFDSALTDASQLRPTLVAMAQRARAVLAGSGGDP